VLLAAHPRSADTMTMIAAIENLTNHFLIAMPGLTDPQFSRTVTYLCQHGDDGALGIIVNRPLELTFGDIMAQMDISVDDENLAGMPVYHGGPVQPERGFVLHEPLGEWKSTLQVSEHISLTTSRDILEAISHGKGPRKMLLALGYAGWGRGQLEQEIVDNSWLNAEAEDSIIFHRPAASRWKAAGELMGVDISLLTTQAGHG
jgi:putative transcriptional regulator